MKRLSDFTVDDMQAVRSQGQLPSVKFILCCPAYQAVVTCEKNRPNKNNWLKANFPGGEIEPGESPVAGADREVLKEELFVPVMSLHNAIFLVARTIPTNKKGYEKKRVFLFVQPLDGLDRVTARPGSEIKNPRIHDDWRAAKLWLTQMSRTRAETLRFYLKALSEFGSFASQSRGVS